MADPLLGLLAAIPSLALFLVNLYGIWLLRQYGAFARFVPVSTLEHVVPPYNPRGLEELVSTFHGTDYLQLLTQIMNVVAKIEQGPSSNALAALQHIRRGGGLTCAGMANLYFHVLRSNGITAREVYLSRSCFDTLDTHVTVEVKVEGGWVIADPTFHVGFEKGGRLVDAQCISQSLRNGTAADIQPRFYGPVRYPTRLDSYYMPWRILFTNVFVVDRARCPLWARIPPFRYWRGPVMYYQRDGRVSYDHLKFQDRVYFLLMVVLPVALLTIFAFALVAGVH